MTVPNAPDRPLFFLEPALLFHLMDSGAILRLKPGKTDDQPRADIIPENTKIADSFTEYSQDGITIFVSDQVQLPPAAQVSLMLKKGWFSKSAEARIVPRQRVTGFMGTRCNS